MAMSKTRSKAAPAPDFTAELFQYRGRSRWIFATIPTRHAPPATHPWGRTPVVATVDGHTWKTSVWRAKNGDGSLLAVPKRIRGAKGHGDSVRVRIEVVPEDP